MANIYDKASLVMIPSGTKDSKIFSQKPVNGDGDFTFSRSTAATRVNADGNIEKETQNLLFQSNSFNVTGWGISGATLTSGQSGYDGTNDAWLIDSSSEGYVFQYAAVVLGTFSVYAKANSVNNLRLRCIGASNSEGFFDLQNGITGTSINLIDSKIEDIGNGWYRCSITMDGTPTLIRIYPSVSSSTSSGTIGSVYIQDAQLEQGLVARDYIETTTTTVEGGITDNVPRLDYTDSSCPALLLEPQRINIVNHSEYFGTYSAGNQTRTANATTSPEGLQNAYKLTATSNFSGLGVTHNLSASTTYTASFYIKNISAGTNSTSSSFPIRIAVYDYTNATTILSETYLDDISTSEWRRMTFSFTTTTAASVLIQFVRDLNNAEEIYIYGAQIEAGSYATSYIPTYGTSVTRNLDACYIATGVDSLVNNTQGSIFMEFQPVSVPEYFERVLRIDDGTEDNVIRWNRYGTLNLQQYIKTDGVTQAIFDLANASKGTLLKVCLVYNNNDVRLYVNGSNDGTDTSATMPSVNYTRLMFANNTAGSLLAPQRISQFISISTALTDQEAIDLTTI